MKIGVFVNQYDKSYEVLDRVKADKVGIILVQNGVYNAVIQENGQPSPIISKGTNIYALADDLSSRGFESTSVDKKVNVVDYNGLVDLIFNEYEKFIWL